MTAAVLDLFAGAGGWEEGLAPLGRQAVGIELDEVAASTAEAAGHERRIGDVAALEPAEFGHTQGLVASAPCQSYSYSGRRLGSRDMPEVVACACELASGYDTRALHRSRCRDPRSLLSVEPLRWTLALLPRWIAFEQVPAVLGLWTLFAGLLSLCGYKTATGILSAERFGLPQTRRRAFLIASLDGQVALPEPTHRSYNPRQPEEIKAEELELRPWISMATALGWRGSGVCCTGNQTHGGERPRGLVRSIHAPAWTVDSASGSWTRDRCEGRQRASTQFGPRRPPPRRGTVRLSPGDAAVLQGFRRDYPFQGTRGQRFTQIGNAVPPPLARLVVAEAMRPTQRQREAR